MKLVLGLFFSFSTFLASAQFACQDVKKISGLTKSINNNAKSDSIDILSYTISLDASNIKSHQINGAAQISFTILKDSVTSINLDLKDLVVEPSIRLTQLTKKGTQKKKT